MTDEVHRQLTEVLRKCEAEVVLSGYASPLYDGLYGNWRTINFEMANHAAGGESERRMVERV